ncbi:ShlB/FhaC/HecB family hemolysin secretion/activation protein, partial [Gloeocapsa sp. PCC 73106]|uniref:ShlB/FhaC/HecB family hemolysin secretion/activation protein n=1 Tax=Gloeocapsa sp. PCC 73106 TaxID=102232 RepID=UPI0002AC170F
RDPQSPFYPNTPLELPEEQQEPILEIPSIQPNIIPSETIPRQVKIKSFEFIGNTVFTKEELETAVAQFINQEISFTQLLQIEAMITNLYMQSGYVNSGAVIEAGQIIEPDAAVIKIRIFEGAIEDIKILGTQRLNPSYIRNRVAFATEKPFNQKRLLEALQLLQLDPLIKNISAELSAGVRPNLSLLTLTIQEADSFDIIPFINNSGNPSIGSFNRGLGLEQGNLSGIGDKLFLIYTNSDGSNRIDVNYTLPLNPNNSTFTIAGGYSSNEVIERVFQELNLTGEYYYTEISWRQPILRNPAQELALGLTFSRQVSRNYLDGIGFPLSFGAEDDGNIKISSVSFFQDWLKRSASEVYGLRSQLTLGVNFFDATNNDNNIPDSNFLLWRTQ